MEKKIDEVFLTRKINNYVESKSIRLEEEIISDENQIAKCIENNDIDLAYNYYRFMLDRKKGIEIVKSFKDYLLKDKKE